MKLKKLLSLTLAGVISASLLVGCSNRSGEDKTIKVGASPTPHAEILEVAKPLLEKQGYSLEVVEFDDYVLPNTSLAEGDLDANYFQHIPYLEQMNSEKDLKLTYTAKVHIEPMGIYSEKHDSLDDLAEGAKIALPNDATNEARALQLLAKNGIIEVADKELITVLIDKYTDLQRIKKANKDTPNEELEYQIKTTTAKLSSMGINVEDLTL